MNHYFDRSFRDRYPLSSKKILKKMVFSSFLLILIFSAIFTWSAALIPGVADLLMRTFAFTIPVSLWAILIGNHWYQKKYIKNYFYNMTDELLIIRKGIFNPQEITVPIERIQDVYVDQDFLDILLGIYDMHVSTATAMSTVRAHIDGVEKRTAEELRELLLNKLHTTRKQPQ